MSLAWLFGVFVGSQAAWAPWLLLGAGLALAAAIAARLGRPRVCLLLTLVAALTLGGARAGAHFDARALDPLGGLRGRLVELTGEVVESPDTRDTTARWVLEVREARVGSAAHPQDGLVQVYARWAPPVRQHDLVRVRGKLTGPPDGSARWHAERLERRGINSYLRYPRRRGARDRPVAPGACRGAWIAVRAVAESPASLARAPCGAGRGHCPGDPGRDP